MPPLAPNRRGARCVLTGRGVLILVIFAAPFVSVNEYTTNQLPRKARRSGDNSCSGDNRFGDNSLYRFGDNSVRSVRIIKCRTEG
jgi:hypothetical protein